MTTVCEIAEGAEEHALVSLLQQAVFQHPLAAQAVFAALVAQGRTFAKTHEGRVWERRLAQSKLLSQGRKVWELATLNVLEENPATVLPSRVVDAFVKLLHERALDTVVARFYAGQEEGDDAATPRR